MDRFFKKVIGPLLIASALTTPVQTSLAQETNGVTHMSAQSRLATSVDAPNAIGYYILTGEGKFYPIEQYIVRGELGLNKLANVSHVPVTQDSDINSIELFINVDNVVDLQRLAPRFFAQSAAIINPDYVKALDFQAEQVAENLFRVRLTNIEKGDIVTVVDNNAVYAISLGEITENLVSILGSIDWPAYKVANSLEEALKSFPDSQPLKDLLAEKAKDRGNDKLNKISSDIDAKLAKFNAAEKHGSKLVHAKDVAHEIRYYEAVAEELGATPEQRILDLKTEMQTFIDTPEVVELPVLNPSLLGNQVSYYQTSAYSGSSVGAGNIQVSVVAVGDNDLLIRFRGIANEFDGKVLRARKEITNDSLNTYIAKTNEDNFNKILPKSLFETNTIYIFIAILLYSLFT